MEGKKDRTTRSLRKRHHLHNMYYAFYALGINKADIRQNARTRSAAIISASGHGSGHATKRHGNEKSTAAVRISSWDAGNRGWGLGETNVGSPFLVVSPSAHQSSGFIQFFAHCAWHGQL